MAPGPVAVYLVVGNEPRTYVRSPVKSSASDEEEPLKSLFRRPPKPALPDGERVYAIGDIHGRIDLFDALVEQIEADNAGRPAAKVSLILLGDLIDRGPESRAVVERAMGWDRDFAPLEALLGNHEAAMLAALAGDRRWLESWLTFGGRETLLSYGVEPGLLAVGTEAEIAGPARERMPDSHLAWLRQRPLSIARGDYFFVHAGIRPGRPFGDQDPADLLWIREEFLGSRADHGAIVVHGHSIRERVEQRPNRIGIDTGAFATGRLTALGLEGSKRWFLHT